MLLVSRETERGNYTSIALGSRIKARFISRKNRRNRYEVGGREVYIDTPCLLGRTLGLAGHEFSLYIPAKMK